MRLATLIGLFFIACSSNPAPTVVTATPETTPSPRVVAPMAISTPDAIRTPTTTDADAIRTRVAATVAAQPTPTPTPFTPLDMEFVRSVARTIYPHLPLVCRHWRTTKRSGEFAYLGGCYGAIRSELGKSNPRLNSHTAFLSRALVLAIYLDDSQYGWLDLSYEVVDATSARLIKCESSRGVPVANRACTSFVSPLKANNEFVDGKYSPFYRDFMSGYR